MGKKISIYFFDIFLVIFFIFLFAYSIQSNRFSSGLIYAYVFILIGILSVVSKKIKDTSLICRLLYWINQNMLTPKTKYNYMISGIFSILMGISGIIVVLNGMASKDHGEVVVFWYRDPVIWIIFVLSIILGIYSSKQEKK